MGGRVLKTPFTSLDTAGWSPIRKLSIGGKVEERADLAPQTVDQPNPSSYRDARKFKTSAIEGLVFETPLLEVQ